MLLTAMQVQTAEPVYANWSNPASLTLYPSKGSNANLYIGGVNRNITSLKSSNTAVLSVKKVSTGGYTTIIGTAKKGRNCNHFL